MMLLTLHYCQTTLPLIHTHASPLCFQLLFPFWCHLGLSLHAGIRSVPNESAGGRDKLKPQRSKDLVQGMESVDESPFLSALMDFCTMVLHGDVPAEVRPLFFWRISVGSSQEMGRSSAHCFGIYAASFGCEDCQQVG